MPKNRYKTVTTSEEAKKRTLTYSSRVKVVTLPENYTIVGGNVIYDMDTGLRVGCITLCSGGKDLSHCTVGEDNECSMLPHLVRKRKR